MSSWEASFWLANPGAQLWVKRYNGGGYDDAESVAVSPTGKTVFVTGQSAGTSGYFGYATVAYNAATGARLWVKRYNGPGNNGVAYSVALSPTGKTVFVTGGSAGTTSGEDYATVAYNAATGARLWVRRYNGSANYTDEAKSAAVSPTGKVVFVTGYSWGKTASPYGYATVAYNTATGARLWVKRYDGPANSLSVAESVAVSPTGKTVFVTGGSAQPGGSVYATVAYNATTGAEQWVKRYSGPANATSVAVSPNGGTVYVTGESFSPVSNYDYATIAYNAATGAREWVRRYNGPGNGADTAHSVAVSPTGKMVFVTGESYGGSTSTVDYATVAYNAATGAQAWVKRYNGRANGADYAYSVAVSPSGRMVYVAGQSGGASSSTDYATAAYNAATGAQLWVRRYGGASSLGTANSMAVSRTSGTVFVTGYSDGDYATIAYRG